MYFAIKLLEDLIYGLISCVTYFFLCCFRIYICRKNIYCSNEVLVKILASSRHSNINDGDFLHLGGNMNYIRAPFYTTRYTVADGKLFMIVYKVNISQYSYSSLTQ